MRTWAGVKDGVPPVLDFPDAFFRVSMGLNSVIPTWGVSILRVKKSLYIWLDYPSNMSRLTTRQITLIAAMSAVSIVVAYSKGLALSSLPGVFEFMTVLIFVTGFCFGTTVGGAVGVIALTIYMLIPSPFAHPAAWLFSTSPILLAVMALLGGMFGVAGGFLSKRIESERTSRFTLTLGVVGLVLTFVYDIMSSVGFALAYPGWTTIRQALWLTFVPLYYPWPPIVHTASNALIFALVAPVLIIAIKKLPEPISTSID